jgi:hypothetical protein
VKALKEMPDRSMYQIESIASLSENDKPGMAEKSYRKNLRFSQNPGHAHIDRH